jgi:hypothetical protein
MKMLPLSILMVSLLFALGSMFPSFDAQSTSNVVDTSAGNNPSFSHLEAARPNVLEPGTLNAKAADPCERSTDNAESNKADTTETENRTIAGQPTVTFDPPPTNVKSTRQDSGNGATEGLFPDGRIFLEGGPPYGYVPTCTPKGPAGIPTIPIEP